MSDNQDNSGEAQASAPVIGFDIGLSDTSELTYDIPFSFDADGKASAGITVVGKNSQQYKDADRALSRVALKKSAVRGRPLDLKKDSDSDEFLDQRESTNVALAVAITVGWFGLTDKGAEFPFSKAAAQMLYSKNSVVRDKVLVAVEDASNFLKR
jgi:hypothetical protein